jgi:hypothetical protein
VDLEALTLPDLGTTLGHGPCSASALVEDEREARLALAEQERDEKQLERKG